MSKIENLIVAFSWCVTLVLLTNNCTYYDDKKYTQNCRSYNDNACDRAVVTFVRLTLVVIVCIRCIIIDWINWTGCNLKFACRTENKQFQLFFVSTLARRCVISDNLPRWQLRESVLSGHSQIYDVYLYRHKCVQSPLFSMHGDHWCGWRLADTARMSKAPPKPDRISCGLFFFFRCFDTRQMDLLYQLDQYKLDSYKATLNGCAVCSTICLRSPPSKFDTSMRSSNASAQYNSRLLQMILKLAPSSSNKHQMSLLPVVTN